MTKLLPFTAVALWLLTACQSGAPWNFPLQPEFSISAALTSPAGGTITTYSVTVTAASGFSGSVALATGALPPDATASFSPATISGSGTSVLTIVTSPFTPVGTYPITVGAASGLLVHTAPVSVTVLAPAVGPATLTGTFSASSGDQNLTALGTSDWAYWGLISASSFDHKNHGFAQISNYTILNSAPGSVGLYNPYPVTFTWTDGTPDTSAASSANGVYIAGSNAGFQISAPADTTRRSLTIYLGLFATQGRIVAHLSDGSAPDYVDTSFTAVGSLTGAYTFNYQASSPGQSLILSYTNIGSGGNIFLQAATLSISPSTFYVSTTGSPSGDGTFGNPWDLTTALQATNHIGPGSRVWIEGGSYGDGTALSVVPSLLQGTSQNPVIVRAMPRQSAIINGGIEDHGSFTWFWGLEISSSVLTRAPDRNAPEGIGAYDGTGSKYINLVIHDTAQGLGLWESATNTEAYGCLVYYNGYQDTDRGHGHGVYTQNNTGTKLLRENIIFKQFGLGIQAYGTDLSHVQGYQLTGNIVFDNGIISTNAARADNILFAAGSPLAAINLQQNFTYETPGGLMGYSRLGWGFGGGPNVNLVAQNNIWMGNAALEVWDWNSVTFTGNTLYGPTGLMSLLDVGSGQSTGSYNWDQNTYFGSGVLRFNGGNENFVNWQQTTGMDSGSTITPGRPTGIWTFVRPNQFEAGRGNIVIYNWDNQLSVAVDLTSLLLPGQTYQLLDAQNFLGSPVLTGTFDGNPILIPMNNTTVAAPVGTVPSPPSHTPGEFAVFVLTLVP